ncbi:hypothetical protein AEP_01598 [Curvibacter sp. AEP1-3]|uniref:DUF6765 family protein n=1 Tax=Curvibacter sp. AEP1-3 TaxID=1844971 RepID=UPI000B3C1AA5|nr:DUF6765 family protein [Curvibacter sp. AEP1-3]ARV18542.1 hypothetical protein AEP_01598 [Curvibacter sp. AEP1-3]
MQIDFHHTATYVIARLAGFSHEDADIISYSAQYVDDSLTEGFIEFENGMRYQRFPTAHPTYDPQNLSNNNANALSWQPFHFLPGNMGKPEGEGSETSYEERLICKPDSFIAKAMMKSAIADRGEPWGLHRLGISAHVFVDTFAHQEFVGLNHYLNEVKDGSLCAATGEPLQKLHLPPMGHGQVNTYPDRPFLSWSYVKSYNEEIVKRENPAIFLNASVRLYEEFKRYLSGNAEAEITPMPQDKQTLLLDIFKSNTSEEEGVRHANWLAAVASDHFGFGAVSLSYDGKGNRSWKTQALGSNYFEKIKEKFHSTFGISQDVEVDDVNEFFSSNYKLFHDAAKQHRHTLITEIFPKFGIFVG